MATSHPVTPSLLPSLRRTFSEGRAKLLACLPTADEPVTDPPRAPRPSPDSTPPADGANARHAELGRRLGQKNAALSDQLIASICAEQVGPMAELHLALAGVGGYGRGAVALFSDLDLRFLCVDPGAAAAIVDALLYPLWDAGVPLGHQVVAMDELLEAARTDLPSATSLLDWRHLAGDTELSNTLRQRALAGVFAPSELSTFIGRLLAAREERHARFGGSVYLLEPDVKNGPGGLRDLDFARWAAKARYGVGELPDLVRLGVLVPREAREIEDASEMLWRIRNLLHAHAGRRSDRLTFDEQEVIARLLGYGRGGEAVERMMSAYYVAARTISRGLDMIAHRCTPASYRRRPKAETLGDGAALFDGCVTTSENARLEDDPDLALRLLEAAVAHDVPLLPYARDAIVRVSSDAGWTERLRASKPAIHRFVKLCLTKKETALRRGSVMQELHDLGILLAMIPEFSPVVGRVHHDTYHVYTVDVHSVAAVDRLAALMRGDLAEEYPLASQLAAQLARPEVLCFATLLHDVGKAIGGRDHSRRGAEMAQHILRRLEFDKHDIDDACHLIHEHLSMYHAATRRDLDDPAAIAEFAAGLHGREGLRHLYLLTVVDISTTSPTSMTSWKAGMLDQLFLLTDAELAGRRDADLSRRQEDVLAAADALPARSRKERQARREFVKEFLESMPDRYCLANPPAAIAAHAELARKHADHPVSVALVPSRHADAAEICVIARDRPGLLASIAAALGAARLEVLGAQVHSRPLPDGTVQAVDLFWARDRGEGAQGVARALPKLTRELDAIARGRRKPRELVPDKPRRDRSTPNVATRVTLEHRASPKHTVIEVTTRDRPGLLYTIADALFRSGLTIAVAKINTEGAKVADVFYVTEADGSKVARGARSADVERGIVAALEDLESGGKG